jgi:hypothetical protein
MGVTAAKPLDKEIHSLFLDGKLGVLSIIISNQNFVLTLKN